MFSSSSFWMTNSWIVSKLYKCMSFTCNIILWIAFSSLGTWHVSFGILISHSSQKTRCESAASRARFLGVFLAGKNVRRCLFSCLCFCFGFGFCFCLCLRLCLCHCCSRHTAVPHESLTKEFFSMLFWFQFAVLLPCSCFIYGML